MKNNIFLKFTVSIMLIFGLLGSFIDLVKADDTVQDFSRQFNEQHSGYITQQQQLRRNQLYNQYNVWELEGRMKELENKRLIDQLRLNSKLRDLEDNQF